MELQQKMRTVWPKPRAILTLSVFASVVLFLMMLIQPPNSYDSQSQNDDKADKHDRTEKKVEEKIPSKSLQSSNRQDEKSGQEKPAPPKMTVEQYQKIEVPIQIDDKEQLQPSAPDPILAPDGLQIPRPDLQYPENHIKSAAEDKTKYDTPTHNHLNSSGYPILYNGRFVPTRRIVHLDLKGAPPKVAFYEEFFKLISRLGATGLLIEWEDMFPYKGELAGCRNGNAYSEADVKTILTWAKENNLEVIPLVQTFGHLEWVLKHEKFAGMREVEKYAQVICLSNPDAVSLVKTIIDQVLSLHKEVENGTFFHMGADEAFQVGQCGRCSEAIKKLGSKERLMLKHIKNIAQYVREKHGRRVLAWHDMLNSVHLPELNESQIGQYVEPVVWAYAERVPDYIRPDLWNKFSQAFPFIWSASAFKGADGPDRFYSNLLHYMRNHFTWAESMTSEYQKFQEFRGVILTGWQRFDHFAILCELLPVGMPSLALNLQIVMHGGHFPKPVLKETSRILGCARDIDVDSKGIAAYDCKFPGYEAYKEIQWLKQIDDGSEITLSDDYQLKGWLNPFNIRHNYSSAWYLQQIQQKITRSLTGYKDVAKKIRLELEKLYYNDAVDEFLMEYVETKMEKLVELDRAAKEIMQLKTFPLRPFQIQLRPFMRETAATSRKMPNAGES